MTISVNLKSVSKVYQRTSEVRSWHFSSTHSATERRLLLPTNTYI